MNYLPAVLAFVGGWLVSSYHKILMLFVARVRINPDAARNFHNKFSKLEKKEVFSFVKTIGNFQNPPNSENAIYRIQGKFVWRNFTEQFLKAGFQSTQIDIFVSSFRWNNKWLCELCNDLCVNSVDQPEILLTTGSYLNSFGNVPDIPKNYRPPQQANSFLEVCEKVMKGEEDKTGIILTGVPGNGKSTFVKYLSYKFHLDVVAFTFSDEMSNHMILHIFRDIMDRERPCIVLFEDFDNIFSGRTTKKKEVKYSFDVILNALDGAYFHHKKRIFVMTTNHLEEIDHALKRPGRFDHIINFDNPSKEEIVRIFPDIQESFIDQMEGMTVAELYALTKNQVNEENILKVKEMFSPVV